MEDRINYRAPKRLLYTVLSLVLSGFGASAGDIYVATNGNNSTGGNWPNAYTSVHAAFSIAAPQDTIHVAGHVFALTNALSWTSSGVTLKGGYEATNESGTGSCDPERWPTVITRNPSFNTRLLEIQSVSNAVVENITFRDGHVVDASYGGGVLSSNVTNLVLRSCRFSGNYIDGAWSVAAYGGGLAAVNTFGYLSNVVFATNTVMGGGYRAGNGGGAYLSGGSIVLSDCQFIGNHGTTERSSYGRGAACAIDSGTHTLRNVLVSFNRTLNWSFESVGQGGGIYIAAPAIVTIENATLYGNMPEGLYNLSASTVVSNSILYGNIIRDVDGTPAPKLFRCDVGDGTGAGTNGTFSVDPGFAEDWFYLESASPCVDAGSVTPESAGLGGRTTQTDGTIDTGNVDLGYHYNSGVVPYQTLYVSEAGSDGADGAGWPTALRSLTRALQLAEGRTRIHIGAGNYTFATEQFPLKIRDGAIQILGTNAAVTRFDATNGNASIFDFVDAWGPNRIEGVTIRGAGPKTLPGSGVKVLRSRVTLDRCRIMENKGVNDNEFGAGVRADQSAVTLLNCAVVSNIANANWSSAGSGGGLYAADSITVVSNCLFDGNVSIGGGAGRASYGGGLYLLRSNFEISDCVIVSNQAKGMPIGTTSAGGGLYFINGKARLRNLVVAYNLLGNAATNQVGGGLWAFNNAVVLVENSTIVSNFGTCGVRGIDGYLKVSNSILRDNQAGNITNVTPAAFSYSCAPELTNGAGNLASDPLFVNPAQGDYRLRSAMGQRDVNTGNSLVHPETSPCIDAGTNTLWILGWTDLQGLPRLSKGKPGPFAVVDMGAFETLLVSKPGTVITIF